MSKEKSINGPHTEAFKKTQEIIEDLKVCMMTTETPEGHLRSRPMTCYEANLDGTLWFFAAKDSDQTVAFDYDENVNLAFACTEKSRYLSIVGTAEIVKDRKKVEKLWSPEVNAWFPKGHTDPRLCLIRVKMERAEYWDSPSSKMIKLFEIAKAIVTGKTPEAGMENERVRIS
jgi:general stress protein 26